MIRKILDLHIHSKYSRACSRDLVLPNIAAACAVRGIDIVATGDFTHPRWMEHVKESLVEDGRGVYKLSQEPGVRSQELRTRFIVGTELACIKKHKEVTRRVHLLLFAPSIEAAEKLNIALTDRGFNLKADGRPILGITCKDLLQMMLEIDDRMVMIPAHAWTPWFGIFGSKGGYNSMEEAFEELTPRIFAIETGLSSDPVMNWQWSKLDHISLISNSDAHSTAKLGREANVMQFDRDESVTYDEIMRILREGDRERFVKTIEFYPEEGKYHYDGHAPCEFSCPPNETKKYGGLCPKCKKKMTIGVLHRVLELADRSEEIALKNHARVPFQRLVPLPEIIADTYENGVASKKVQKTYNELISKLGSEFYILVDAPLSDIERASDKTIANAVDRVRQGNIHVIPGYDGVFGVVKVFGEKEDRGGQKQIGLVLD